MHPPLNTDNARLKPDFKHSLQQPSPGYIQSSTAVAAKESLVFKSCIWNILFSFFLSVVNYYVTIPLFDKSNFGSLISLKINICNMNCCWHKAHDFDSWKYTGVYTGVMHLLIMVNCSALGHTNEVKLHSETIPFFVN